MIKTNPALASFSDEDILNEILYRTGSCFSPAFLKNVLSLSVDKLKTLYFALVYAADENVDYVYSLGTVRDNLWTFLFKNK